MKRIIICCDGTWNTPDETADGLPIATNVVLLAENVDDVDEATGTRQLMFYDPGVGTAGSWLQRVYDGATGSGISANILQAYRFLIENYEIGDELFLFGFSRGAFTVRSLAGLIRKCGILRTSARGLIGHAYALYRSRAIGSHPRAREAVLFRKTYAVEEVTSVRCIGVWDTVGALGNPLYTNVVSTANSFHDTDLSSTVRAAFHALAIDEKRRNFKASLWTQQPGSPKEQVLEQAWFAGVHSNIGGGYERTGLSDVAFGWMLERARSCGLGISPVATKPNALEPLHESRTGIYRLVPAFHRPIDARAPGLGATNESVDHSVLARYRMDPAYRPRNLVAYLKRHPELQP